ncbi:hypothetical protein V8G54_024418 [Vigna mungo]|uniref:Growth-regulating factor n=1 Tax=Vigna mungo TaxID=3915 RepID=A0AAQ3N699_VIGMU
MTSGISIPPDLLFTIKGSYFDSPLRTDGKKWRCSKEAYPYSNYCERYMHRGKNRSRKLVEVLKTTPSTNTNASTHQQISSITKINTLSPLASSESHQHHPPHHAFFQADQILRDTATEDDQAFDPHLTSSSPPASNFSVSSSNAPSASPWINSTSPTTSSRRWPNAHSRTSITPCCIVVVFTTPLEPDTKQKRLVDPDTKKPVSGYPSFAKNGKRGSRYAVY